jgi:hypothetical protein
MTVIRAFGRGAGTSSGLAPWLFEIESQFLFQADGLQHAINDSPQLDLGHRLRDTPMKKILGVPLTFAI